MNDTPPVQTRAIGRYTILRELRRERHSVSYAAVDPVMNRQLVVKAVELLPAGVRLSPEERKRVEQAFVRQAQAAGRLQHPHIVTVFDAGLSHAFGFLVIERINGRPLHELLAGGLRPAFVQCASIAARIADALECAHSNGVAHGHLGPQHVYLLGDGSPKVSGFGGWIDDGASGDEALAGTERLLPYFQNEITEETRRADVRALGQLLFMMLAGRAPPAAPADAEAGTPASPTLAARPDTPPALARLVDQSLLADPAGAARSAGALRDALTAFIWNERTDSVAPNSLGIPLAAPPPQRAPVHVATITAADGVAPLAEPPAVAAAREAFGAPASLNGAALPVDIPNPLLTAVHGVVERVRPWATRNRLPLSAAGALLSVGIFLGVLLGNLRHPETGTPPPVAARDAPPAGIAPSGRATDGAADSPSGVTAPVPAVVISVPVSFEIRPWGEIYIDGKPTGVTPPLTQVPVPVGHHHVEIRHGSSPAWQTDIDVQGTTTVRIEHSFAP
jgi:serine/threonine-protein kinase